MHPGALADRLSLAVRPEAFDIVKGEFRTGGDNQIIIIHLGFVRHADTFIGRIDLFCLANDQFNISLVQRLCEIDRDFFPLPPADQYPRI